MAAFDLRSWLRIGSPPPPSAPQDPAAEALRKQMQARCAHFRRLLAANKVALEIMADMEEHLTPKTHGTYRPFDMTYVRASTSRVGAAVYQMIHSLNALSNGAYASLRPAFLHITKDIEALLGYAPPITAGPLVLTMEQITAEDTPLTGGKMAQLGQLHNVAHMPVPEGFVITAAAYHKFMQINNLHQSIAQRIEQYLQETNGNDLQALYALSNTIRQRIFMATMPHELEKAITDALTPLRTKYGTRLRLALRSSAVGEDVQGVSFAGQFATELNISAEDVLDVWREIISSKYSVAAMTYRYTRGIVDESMPMCVGVLCMVDAVAGGVVYSQNPTQPHDTVLINAVPGLPKTVVDGAYTPDTILCDRGTPPRVLQNHTAHKPWQLVFDKHMELAQRPLDATADTPTLDETQAANIAALAIQLEQFYQRPQDIEWAIDTTGAIVILQSRELHLEQQPSANNLCAPQPRDGLPVALCGGVNASTGVGMGKVYVAHAEADMLAFPRGAVLVVEHAHPYWATLLPHAAALITERGGAAGHLASVAREYALPAIFGLKDASTLLQPDTPVTVDSANCCVYMGLHENILPPTPLHNPMNGSPVLATLQAVMPHVTPLHLLTPESDTFTPEHCQSLHDITRFCHEKSVQLLFTRDDSTEQTFGKQLKVGKKLQYWVMDMDDGFTHPVVGPTVELDEIQSIPMLALWEGMTFVPWQGPPSLDASSFMSAVLESTMRPQLETTVQNPMAQKNFCIISKHYLNLQARFGYHFCTVDANVTENAYENYVSFQCKGGAASADRRITRVQLIARILQEHGFRCDIRSDAIFAIAEGRSLQRSARYVAMLGHLLIHTRQIDVVMNNPHTVACIENTLRDQTSAILHAN